jgi:hypothetical protein
MSRKLAVPAAHHSDKPVPRLIHDFALRRPEIAADIAHRNARLCPEKSV